MANVPAVSVVIPTFNAVPFLRDTLEAVFAQTLLPREILIVDDASTDGTLNLVTALAPAAPVPLRLLRLTRNSGGPVRPMNTGIAAARTELVALVDQDDLLVPHKLQAHAEALSQHPAALAFGAYQRFYPDDRIDPVSPVLATLYAAPQLRQLPGSGYVIPPQRILHNLAQMFDGFGGASGMTLARPLWLQLGGFDRHLAQFWDIDYAIRLAAQGQEVLYVPGLAYYRRIHRTNFSFAQGGRKAIRFLFEVFRKHAHNPQLTASQRADIRSLARAEFYARGYQAWEAHRSLQALALYLYLGRFGGILEMVSAIARVGVLGFLTSLGWQGRYGGEILDK